MIKILVESDLHCGHIMGLTPPEYWTEELKEVHEIMWNFRQSIVAKQEFDYHFCLGDLTEGPGKKDSHIGLITTDLKKQAQIAIKCLEEVKAKKRFFVYGTPFHTAANINIEELIAEHFESSIKDTQKVKIAGKKFNLRHLCGRSDTPYGQFTQIGKEIIRDLIQSIMEDTETADYYLRGHVHYEAGVSLEEKKAFTLPSWKLNIPFSGGVFERTLRGQYYNVGNLIIEIDEESGRCFEDFKILKFKNNEKYMEV